MPEIWENPFANAHLKVERAKHIADIDKRLRTSSDTYGPSLHRDLKTGEQFVHYRMMDETLLSDIALIVGDAVHNLHSALDIAWGGIMQKLSPAGYTRYTKFPVPDSRHKLVTDLTKTGKISDTSPLFDLMVNSVKSYQGGDSDICALHALDIHDKHSLLIPVLTVAGIDGVELENEDGTITQLTIRLTRPNSYRKVVPLNSKFKNNGEVRFEITFREGTPTHGLPVVPTLLRFHAKTLKLVRIFQRMALNAK